MHPCIQHCVQFWSTSQEGGSGIKEDTETVSQNACEDGATALWGETKKADILQFGEKGEGSCDEASQNHRCDGLAKSH